MVVRSQKEEARSCLSRSNSQSQQVMMSFRWEVTRQTLIDNLLLQGIKVVKRKEKNLGKRRVLMRDLIRVKNQVKVG